MLTDTSAGFVLDPLFLQTLVSYLRGPLCPPCLYPRKVSRANDVTSRCEGMYFPAFRRVVSIVRTTCNVRPMNNYPTTSKLVQYTLIQSSQTHYGTRGMDMVHPAMAPSHVSARVTGTRKKPTPSKQRCVKVKIAGPGVI